MMNKDSNRCKIRANSIIHTSIGELHSNREGMVSLQITDFEPNLCKSKEHYNLHISTGFCLQPNRSEQEIEIKRNLQHFEVWNLRQSRGYGTRNLIAL